MLNPRTIESAIRSGAAEQLLIDNTGERGTGRLALRIRTSGDNVRAEWLAVWWRDGRRRFGVMGRYPTLSLRQARDQFTADWRPDIEAGRDPRRMRVVAAAAGTVEELFQDYVASMKQKGRRSWREVERALLTGKGNAADAFGRDTKAADVSSEMVTDYLARVYQRGSRTAADRYRSYLHAAFQWGAQSTHDYTRPAGAGGPKKNYGLRSNPVAVVPRDEGATQARDRTLSPEELQALWLGVDGPGFGLSTTPAIRLLICTGQRVLDVLRAEGREFDLAEKLWTIPAAKRKKPELGDHVVPLTPQAVAIVRELIKVRGQGLLFPNGNGADGEHVPDQTINRAISRWTRRVGAAPFQARDLRRTWKTLAGEAGIPKDIRDRVQGHALNDVSSVHYDRYQYLREKRAAMGTWSRWLARTIRRKAPERRRAA